ncbi:MAG: rhombosortase [Marinagarivorans sp.]|nr:rhombosortase [Marinagarivorans sp.]
MFTLDVRGIIPHQPRYKHAALLMFVALLLGFGLLPESVLQQLQFPFNGEFSLRWYSAHFIHLNFKHALMNASGAVLIWLLVCAFLPCRLLLTLVLVLPFAISAGLNLTPQEFVSYRGFSGAIYGFFAAGIIWHWWQQRFMTLVLALFLMGKLVMEQMPHFDNGYLLLSIGGLVAVDAHLYGALTGAFLVIVYILLARLGLFGCRLPWVVKTL